MELSQEQQQEQLVGHHKLVIIILQVCHRATIGCTCSILITNR